MKYNKREYSVRDEFCKKLINICFIPFSGNGIDICRKYELGQCPSKDECKELYRINKEVRKKLQKQNNVNLPF
jgi:hypothetical protein